MDTEPQESPINTKMLVLVAVVLALVLLAFCYVVFLIVRSRQAAQTARPQLAQTENPFPALATPTVVVLLPVVVSTEAPAAVAPVETPAPAPVLAQPASTVWRFLRIDKNDVGTFEKVDDPSQRLAAKCINPLRKAPPKGALYTLDDSGILKPQEGGKKFQRFEVLPEQ